MPLTLHSTPNPLLAPDVIASWQGIPAAIVTDELNRAGAMDAGIKPVAPGSSFVGQALTVECMVADNSALHYALTVAWPAAVLVVNAGGYLRNAVWGSILHRAGELRGLAAVVVDGAVRDLAELRRSRVPVYARGGVPAGPHKAWGGAVNAPIQCGGVAIAAGDLLIGDDDGIAVIRPDQLPGLLERCRARMAKEVEMVKAIESGARTVDLIGLPSWDKVGKG